jgi:hypothetical protein
MSTRTFLSLVFVVPLSTLGMLMIEQYRKCVGLGYTDCPRIGRRMHPGHQKRSAPSDRRAPELLCDGLHLRDAGVEA